MKRQQKGKRAKTEKVANEKIPQYWREMEYSDMGQTRTAEHAEPEVEADVKPTQQDVTCERETNETSEEESREEKDQMKGENNNMPIPIKGEVIWENKATRS